MEFISGKVTLKDIFTQGNSWNLLWKDSAPDTYWNNNTNKRYKYSSKTSLEELAEKYGYKKFNGKNQAVARATA